MINIGTSAYNSTLNYSSENERVIKNNDVIPYVKPKKTIDKMGVVGKKDRVSLSNGVEIAKLRESLGLNPTGKLNKEDVEKVAVVDKEKISAWLKSAINDLNIESNNISFSLNRNGKIEINGSFVDKQTLQRKMNNDNEFVRDFERLSTNKEITDYADNTKTRVKGTNLFSVINNESAFESLSKTATNYGQSRENVDPLVKLMQLSRQNNPFEFTYNS